MKTILLGAALLAFAAAALGQQYKWVDKDGKVRYGDVPPPGVKATPLRPPPPAASAPSAPSAPAGKKDEKKLTPEQAFQKRQKDQKDADEKTAKERQDAEVKRANCEQAQSYARTLAAGRVSRANSAGEQVYLSDAEIASEQRRTQQAISEWCK
jgi:type IV secretory pathway VirB10-like protein